MNIEFIVLMKPESVSELLANLPKNSDEAQILVSKYSYRKSLFSLHNSLIM